MAAEDSKKIQLYSLATPNGQKVSIALEEMRLQYDAHTVNIMTGDQFKPEFIAINPNSKIPAIVDPDGPGGQPLAVFESGAILLYLAEKSGGQFLPADPRLRWETIEWVFFQMGGIGPMFGQFGHFFKYARDKCDHPYPVERYTNEARRLLGVLEARLEGRDFLIDAGYTVADMATFPWVECLSRHYGGDEQLKLAEFPRVMAWKQRCMARPLTAKGMNIMTGDQFKPEFIAINPNSKIPAIVDPDGPGGQPLAVFESGAILLYLAEKSGGQFLPADPRLRWETIEWVFFQMGGIGPMFGQFGHFFKYARDKCDHPYPVERYTNEARRLLGVLEARLEGRDFLIDAGYTVADMATFPWVECLSRHYGGDEQLKLAEFPRVMAWKQRCMARPLTAKGMDVCAFPH
eukprot:TRINITY_DN16919_c0_g1_i1.p1 TRINITY_DN16919_c0_g1~~TRINITY_DN16919_c0_g1_i1.p1  ORF type:complete len:404 (-),score=17.98 TRINITY_DN16919_c0_g1_i1:214-1425(-)